MTLHCKNAEMTIIVISALLQCKIIQFLLFFLKIFFFFFKSGSFFLTSEKIKKVNFFFFFVCVKCKNLGWRIRKPRNTKKIAL